MATGEWIVSITGALIALAGLALLAWALLADRLRTRRLRRQGALRRCPRCWYDMSAVAGLTCPECGRTAKRERGLRRSRRRRRAAALAIVLLLVGTGAGLSPAVRRAHWERWLPDTAVILWIRLAPDRHWAVNEMTRRIDEADPRRGSVDLGRSLADWQWDVLTSGLLRVLDTNPSPAVESAVWRTLVLSAPADDRVCARAVAACIPGPTTSGGFSMTDLRMLAHGMSDEQIALACEQLGAPGASGGSASRARAELQGLLALRRSTAGSEALGAIAAMELTPGAIVGEMERCTPLRLAALYERLGVGRSDLLSGTSNPANPLLTVRARELLLDGDDVPDALLVIEHSWSKRYWDALAFVRRGEAWNFAGRLAYSEGLASPVLSTRRSAAGHRCLVVSTIGLRGEATSESRWYRVVSGELRVVPSESR